MSAKAVYEIGNLIRATVARLGKLIDSHPWRARWDAGISRVQMLMKVIHTEADNGDMHTLYAFGAQSAGHGPRRASHRLRLPICEIGEVVDMPPRNDQAVTDVWTRVSVRRGQVESDDLRVFPEEAAR